MEYDDLLKIAGGRIWAGNRAQELGLVDSIGSLEDVIKHVAEVNELEDYKVKYFTRDLEPWEIFLEISRNANIELPYSATRELLLQELNAFEQLVKQDGKFKPISYCSECELFN
jgi:protease-4